MIFYSKYRLRLILESSFRPQGEGNARLTPLLTYSVSRTGVPVRGQSGWDQGGTARMGNLSRNLCSLPMNAAAVVKIAIKGTLNSVRLCWGRSCPQGSAVANRNSIRVPVDDDGRLFGKEVQHRFRIVSIKYACQLPAGNPAANIDLQTVVTIELFGDLGDRIIAKHEPAFAPGSDLAGILDVHSCDGAAGTHSNLFAGDQRDGTGSDIDDGAR